MSRWSTMSERVQAYLRARRQLGYALRIEGKQLQRFARFAEAQGHRGPVTVALALAWAAASSRGGPLGHARRLEVVRPFARYCASFEPDTEVPPARLLGPAHRRLAPHIYTEEEVSQLLAAAAALPPRNGLRPATVRCLLGLLVTTGLRISEALRLSRTDVDLDQGLLTVHQTKFHKSRYVPLHRTACEALAEYARLRDGRLQSPQDPAFFLLDGGRALGYRQALYAFQQIRTGLGWDQRPGRRPRLYDLRHTFACRRLLAWYRDGTDVHWAMPLLATYLGHVKVTDTYWYLSGIPELLAEAARRFEQLAQRPAPEVAP